MTNSNTIKWIKKSFASQENTFRKYADICWSTSDSSDNENFQVNPPERLHLDNASPPHEFKMTYSENESPIIKNRRKLIKRKRKKYKLNLEKSNDLFGSDENSTELIILPGTTEAYGTTMCIETFPSEYGSPVGSDWISGTPCDDIFFNKPLFFKQKKARLKGLSLQLDRIVNVQKSRATFWKHEITLDNSLLYGKDSVHLYIRKQWKEYGKLLYESMRYNNDNKNEMVIVVVNDDLVIGNIYSVFPPFGKKIIVYNEKLVECIFNVMKINLLK